jgi:hypothetical protein
MDDPIASCLRLAEIEHAAMVAGRLIQRLASRIPRLVTQNASCESQLG